jgi:CheY-like chemotaxis protein
MMPDMDGIATFEKLQANPLTKDIPVILLTAKIQASDRRRYSKLGIVTAIAKPFNPLELAGQVATALGWSLENGQT